jgi:lipoteichoic acid synthase
MYFLLNSGRGGDDWWWQMLSAHIDRITLLALCAPFLLGIAAAFLSRRLIPTKPSTSYVKAAVLLPVTLGIILCIYRPALADVRYAREYDNIFLALRDAFPSFRLGVVEAMRQESAQSSLFDTSAAALRPGRQVRPLVRNVIVIMMESAQAKATTVYNPALPTTPFLADLAKRGATVSDMYAVIPRTQAAWMSILYGIYPSTNDIVDRWPFLPGGQKRFKSLPKLLEGQGYATGFITTTNAIVDQAPIQGMGFQWVETGKTLSTTQGAKEVNYDGFEDGLMVEPALTWIDTQSTAKHPFFLAMMTNVGHEPYTFPPSWKKRTFGTGNPSYENYLNCMAYIDSVLRDFFHGLDRLGVLQNSLIVILGDHGESFGEHGGRQHIMVPYEEALKIPMIVYADGLIPPGSSITGLRQEPDILPTVLDALGLQGERLIIPGVSALRPVSPNRTLYYSTPRADSESFLNRNGSA